MVKVKKCIYCKSEIKNGEELVRGGKRTFYHKKCDEESQLKYTANLGIKY